MKKMLLTIISSGGLLIVIGSKPDSIKNSPRIVSVRSQSQDQNWDETLDSTYVDRLGIVNYTKKRKTHEAELLRHGY